MKTTNQSQSVATRLNRTVVSHFNNDGKLGKAFQRNHQRAINTTTITTIFG